MWKGLEKVQSRGSESGFSLFELIITLGILAILIMGTIPLAQNTVKRQKEIKLRETLRQVRGAIDEFKRDTIGACPQGAAGAQTRNRAFAAVPTDPRSRVVIDDCTIFDTENLDRFPPSLELLVNGVAVRDRGMTVMSGAGLGGSDVQATDINEIEEKIKVYLRHMPVDPMTGESDWNLRSSYQSSDGNWDEINVWDVRSSSDAEALDGTKYSEW